jgi:hypothetical protein
MRDPWGKLVAFVGGAALVAIFGYLGVEAWRDYRTFGDVPRRTGLLGAVQASIRGRQWVAIEGAAWQCGRLVRNIDGGVAFLPAMADDGSMVVARFDHEIRCADVVAEPLTGIIEPMDRKRLDDLKVAGLPVSDGVELRTLDVCVSCGRDNARLGVIMCTAFVFLGLALYPLRRGYQSLRGRAQTALHDAVHAPPERAPQANRTVRAWGGSATALGILCVIYHAVPLHWFGVGAAILGAWMMVFPDRYRALAARAKRR